MNAVKWACIAFVWTPLALAAIGHAKAAADPAMMAYDSGPDETGSSIFLGSRTGGANSTSSEHPESVILRIVAADTASLVPVTKVISDALAHSYAIRSAGLAMEEAKANELQARAAGFLSLDLQARATHFEGLQGFTVGSQFTIPEIANRFEAAVALTQPIYTGGRIQRQKEGAAFQRHATEASRRNMEAETILRATTSYWDWSKAYYAFDSLRASEARMKAHYIDVVNLHASGLATDNNVLAAEVRLEQTRLLLEEALRRERLGRARIAFLTGFEIPKASIPAESPISSAMLPDEAVAIETAKTHRPEREVRQWEVQAAEALTDIARAGLSPQVYLAAEYEQARPQGMIFPPEDKWRDVAFAGIILQWNLLDWGLTRSQVLSAKARAGQSLLRLRQTEEQIVLDVRESRANLQDALARVAVNKRAERSAERNLEVAADLWRNGLERHSTVLDAHGQLTEARYQLIVARADILISQARLDYAQGILDRNERDMKE